MIDCIFENADTIELNLYFEHAKYILNKEDVFSYFTEKEGEGIFTKFIMAIKKAFTAVRKKVVEIFTGKKANDAAAKLEAAVAANPKFANAEVECADYKDLKQLSAETLKKLKDPNADPEKIMEEYKKKRKALLAKIGIGAGAVVGAVITVAMLIKKLRGKKYNETMKDIDTIEGSTLKGIAALGARSQSTKVIVNKKRPLLAITSGLPRSQDQTCDKADIISPGFGDTTKALPAATVTKALPAATVTKALPAATVTKALAAATVTVIQDATNDMVAESQATVQAASGALKASFFK